MSLTTARNIAIIALVALAVTVLPGGGPVVSGILAAILIAFMIAFALLLHRLYRDRRFTLDSLPELDRLILYGSVGLALLDWAAWDRLDAAGGLGILAWIAILALAALGVFWVFTRHRSYG